MYNAGMAVVPLETIREFFKDLELLMDGHRFLHIKSIGPEIECDIEDITITVKGSMTKPLLKESTQ
jgi:hypothetical protein